VCGLRTRLSGDQVPECDPPGRGGGCGRRRSARGGHGRRRLLCGGSRNCGSLSGRCSRCGLVGGLLSSRCLSGSHCCTLLLGGLSFGLCFGTRCSLGLRLSLGPSGRLRLGLCGRRRGYTVASASTVSGGRVTGVARDTERDRGSGEQSGAECESYQSSDELLHGPVPSIGWPRESTVRALDSFVREPKEPGPGAQAAPSTVWARTSASRSARACSPCWLLGADAGPSLAA
jgi:hypothetical protein